MMNLRSTPSPFESGHVDTVTTATTKTVKAQPFRHLCELHVDEAAHLWTVWQSVVFQPHYDVPSLQELEARIQAHIAGMRVHETCAWEICQDTLDIAGPSEIFVAAQIAFRSYDVEKIRLVVECAANIPNCVLGLTSALAWLPRDVIGSWIRKFLASKDLYHKYLAVESSRIRGDDLLEHLGVMLKRQDCMADRSLAIALLKISGETKRFDLIDVLMGLQFDGEQEFWRLYALLLLGRHEYVEALKPYVVNVNETQAMAIQLAFRLLPLSEAKEWISQLVSQAECQRAAIRAVAILGDPEAVPWLIGLTQNPVLARVSGEALSFITGCGIEQDGFSGVPLVDLDAQVQHELESDITDLDEDEGLPWPDTDRLWRYWTETAAMELKKGTRYFLGMEITGEHLENVIERGLQRQRFFAAVELALIKSSIPLYNTQGIAFPES